MGVSRLSFQTETSLTENDLLERRNAQQTMKNIPAILKFKFLAGVPVLMLMFAIAGPVRAQNCLAYEPQTVRLQGRIFRQTFAGRPNYESVKAGDEPETYWILRLPRSVCAEHGASGQDIDDVREAGIRRVQLVLTANQYPRWRRLANRHAPVVVTGTLFHSLTGHHHTRVLLSVASLKSI